MKKGIKLLLILFVVMNLLGFQAMAEEENTQETPQSTEVINSKETEEEADSTKTSTSEISNVIDTTDSANSTEPKSTDEVNPKSLETDKMVVSSEEETKETSQVPSEMNVEEENKVQAQNAKKMQLATPNLSESEIQRLIDTQELVQFDEGIYKGMCFKIPSGNHYFEFLGDVVFDGESNARKRAFTVSDCKEVNLVTKGTFNVNNYGNAFYFNPNTKVTWTIESGNVSLSDNLMSSGDYASGSGITGVKTQFKLYAKENVTLLVNNNGLTGMNFMSGSQIELNFNGCNKVEFSKNVLSSGIHTGMDGQNPLIVSFENCKEVHLDDNYTDAICFSTGDETSSVLNIKNCPNLTMNRNGSWGTNGGHANIVNSTIEANANSTQPWSKVIATASNLYFYSIYTENSKITTNDSGSNCGLWINEGAQGAQIINTEIIANQNGKNIPGYYRTGSNPNNYLANYPFYSGNGIIFCGKNVEITGSHLTTNSNGGSGLAFRNGMDSESSITIKNTSILSSSNGASNSLSDSVKKSGMDYLYESGIVILAGAVQFEDCQFLVKNNGSYGISYYDHNTASTTLLGKTVGAIQKLNEGITEIQGQAKCQNTFINSGSLESNRSFSIGSISKMNEIKREEIYTAPINSEKTKLTRFDLHQNINNVLNQASNSFTYYDPNTNKAIDYSFRYTAINEALNESEEKTAYIWAPVSIIHYDATEGRINATGTAERGYVQLIDTRGDKTPLNNALVTPTKEGINYTENRYATDYTIFGNSLELSEGQMPTAIRDGYTFEGWFYAIDNELVQENQALADNKQFSELYSKLNQSFSSSTPILNAPGDVSKPLEEITVYAKWKKIPIVEPTPTPIPESNPEVPVLSFEVVNTGRK